jgi:hypothetical protein
MDLRALTLTDADSLRTFLRQIGYSYSLDLIQGVSFYWQPDRASVSVRVAVPDPPARDRHLSAQIYTYEFNDHEAIPAWIRARSRS